MASSHRVIDLDKIPVRISKDEAPTPLSVVRPLFISSIVSSWAFVYFVLVISSFSNLVRCVAFQSFSLCLL